jgi:hypothetical protein
MAFLGAMRVALAAQRRERARAESVETLRRLAALYLESGAGTSRDWPHFTGKRFVLWLVASGRLAPERGDLLFDARTRAAAFAAAGGAEAYRKVSLETLRRTDFDVSRLTSYAGLVNFGDDAHSPKGREKTPILADLSFDGGAVVAFSDGEARWLSRAELGVVGTQPVTAGPDGTSPLLRGLSTR